MRRATTGASRAAWDASGTAAVNKPFHPRLFDFQPCAGYASAPLPRPLSGAAGFTGAFAIPFLSVLRT